MRGAVVDNLIGVLEALVELIGPELAERLRLDVGNEQFVEQAQLLAVVMAK